MFVLSKSLQSLCAAIVLLVSIACTGQAAAQAWTQLAPTGGPPSARYAHSAVFNTVGNRMIVFGGCSVAACSSNDVWVLANADGTGGTPAWSQLSPTGGPTPNRYGHNAVYDAANNRMIVFAGLVGAGSCSIASANDVWVLSNADGTGGTPNWTQLSPTGTPPSVRYFHSTVYDPASNSMIAFGGYEACSGFGNDVWVLSNANGLGGTPTWIPLSPTGTPPAARIAHSAIYNTANNRMIVFAGNSGSFNNDVWVLANANGVGTPAWTQLIPTGTPPPARYTHTAVYDQPTNRMVVFGGQDPGYANDTWVLSNADGTGGTPAWSQLSPTGTPPAVRRSHSAVFNAANNRMIVFGGRNGSRLNDTWVLTAANGVNFPVGIDIKAGITPNTINLARDRDITVAILSTSTFNAPASVDRSSLTFGHTGNEASLAFCNTASRDVDGDSRMDLVCHFTVQLAGFQLGDTLGYLSGLTLEGNAIHGSDTVIVK